jgi:homopolymeric O-antigen transport system ATP-binding protein
MSETVIKVENLSKQYRIGAREGYRTFRETLVDAAKAPFVRLSGALSKGLRDKSKEPRDESYTGSTLSAPGPLPSAVGGRSSPDNTIWALKDVSFEVKQGEVVGIIGRNGAGKSTLLKILSKITEPTEGRIELRGRVGSLLEVGTGFHPELTGHENIYLYGAILGMDRWEVTRKFDEIVSFAELEKFIDTPVKKYSSGMYMRLAFAVAAHLEPEILLVDEVLAVGDAAFQKKCLGKMGDVSKAGRTVLFVSHNMGAISRLCPESIWIDDGTIALEGASNEVVKKYQSQYLICRSDWKKSGFDKLHDELSFLSITVKNAENLPTSLFSGNEEILVEIQYAVHQSLSGCQIGTRVYNSENIVSFYTADSDTSGLSALPSDRGNYRTLYKIPSGLLSPGSYYLTVAAHLPYRNTYDIIEQAVVFEILLSGSLTSLDGRLGVVTPLIPWQTVKEPHL